MKAKLLSLLLFLLTTSNSIVAQQLPDLSPWANYGNEWIDYSKKYVRVGISNDGMYKIPVATLAARIQGLTSENVQCWFRGQQIALQIDGENIVFYGRRNDGASDGFMFRPGTEARLDYTTSFFSEEGPHFFTAAKGGEVALRMIALTSSPAGPEATEETYHIASLTKNHSAWPAGNPSRRLYFPFAQRAEIDGMNALNNSFFERHNAFIKLLQTDQVWQETINMPDFFATDAQNASIEFAIHGDGPSTRDVAVHFRPTSGAPADATEGRLRSADLAGHTAVRETYELVKGVNFTDQGAGYLRFSSTTTAQTGAANRNRYGVSFYTIRFPQALKFSGNSKRFHFTARPVNKSRIQLTDVPGDVRVYNISNKNTPGVVSGSAGASTLTLEVDRTADQALDLQVVSSAGIASVQATNLYDVKFDLLYSHQTNGPVDNFQPSPADFDYLVITHEATGEKQVKESAVEFAKYRAGANGGNYKTLAISTRSIYDQFNFGEPSPVAIGRFINYMIQQGVRQAHNVLLVGYGVGRIDNIFKELPHDIPTFGEPGSDVLLVSGLSNAPSSNPDVPAIPIGRIPAFKNQEVLNYLNKVIEYENQSKSGNPADLAWRRTLLNVIGAKVPLQEDGPFKSYIDAANARIDQTKGPWVVKEFSNIGGSVVGGQYEKVNAPIDTDINNGAGVVGYYGHGNFNHTLYDIRNATDPGYTQTSKRYPFLYITGCGVGDVYGSHSALYLAPSWLNTANRGAIAMFANTYLAYTTRAANYMKLLYEQLFANTDATRPTLGGMQVNLARLVAGSGSGARTSAAIEDLSNVHQTALFGDPAIRILLTSDVPLPVSYIDFSGAPRDDNSVGLTWATATEQNNDHFVVERSFDAKSFVEIGKVPSKSLVGNEGHQYGFIDVSPRKGINYYRLKQTDKAVSDAEGPGFEYSNIISVELKSNRFGEGVSVYPNPVSERISIESEEGDNVKDWKLLNTSGSTVLKGSSQSIDISHLAPGVFIIEMTTETNRTIRKKVIKVR